MAEPFDRAERRRQLIAAVARIVGATITLLVLYALVPVPGRSGAGAFVGMVIGSLAFVGVLGWQIRTIARSDFPVVRAVQVIGLAVPVLITAFAFMYLSVSESDPASFSEEFNRVGAIYFTVTTLATVGYGDITPVTDAARILVTSQMLFNLALIAGVARLVILAARVGLQRRDGTLGDDRF